MNKNRIAKIIENPKNILGSDIYEIEKEFDVLKIQEYLPSVYETRSPTRSVLVRDLKRVVESSLIVDPSYSNEAIACTLIRMIYHSFDIRDCFT